MEGVLKNGMMAGVQVDGTMVETYGNSASSFSLGVLDLGAMSSPKRSEWVNMNVDDSSCSEHMLIELWSTWSKRRKIPWNSQ